jgi:hypothetical protein
LRQIRYLLKKWDVDMASFAETQVDWRHADEDHQFDNLFARGSDRRSVAACNSTVRKIPSPRNQRGGTAMMAFGRAVARVQEVDRDETKLGRFCWTKLGGSGKTTYVMTMYMPHNKSSGNTKLQTVWDQHKTHYNSQGKADKEPCRALFEDVIGKLLTWKQEDCEIVLVGDFNEDIYEGKFSERLAKDDLNMSEQILKTTGVKIPPTHDRGSKAICGVFATAGVECKAAEVLKRGSGVGDHIVLLLDVCTHSVLGDLSPRVVPTPGRILRADVHAYKSKYNKVLEQLVDRHRMFEKLTDIMGIPDAALDEYEVQINE